MYIYRVEMGCSTYHWLYSKYECRLLDYSYKLRTKRPTSPSFVPQTNLLDGAGSVQHGLLRGKRIYPYTDASSTKRV